MTETLPRALLPIVMVAAASPGTAGPLPRGDETIFADGFESGDASQWLCVGCAIVCVDDLQCEATEHCDGGACLPDLGQGGPCNELSDCAADLFCVDGVCCADGCAGTCNACNVGGSEGLCASLPPGADPDDECGAVSCEGFYWGWSGDTCYGSADIAPEEATCSGESMCRSPAEECPLSSQGPAAITCHSTCQEPDESTCSVGTTGSCTNVNPGTTTCGLGICERTVNLCAAGDFNSCTPYDIAHSETCNGLDDDCDGVVDEDRVDDGYEHNNTCSAAPGISTLGEGSNWSTSLATIDAAGDNDWYRQRTDESDDFCLGEEGPYYYDVVLTPPDELEYRFSVYYAEHGDTSCNVLGGPFDSVATGKDETLSLTWTGSCSSQDGYTFYIHVYGVDDANSCFPYSLSTSFTKD